ncbi:hypothetical protein FUAX_17390 [Fulvitalea axinellae]|uniref:Por secretion system C-terminal sorting domain-containing protein n=1 Tax=Fulvitalea axinellae TaxID=1182444 RepID=A0AAU9CV30_9BACT|nr:hypothetical protein FUAX_17390 [Fulvitalea axinellae]
MSNSVYRFLLFTLAFLLYSTYTWAQTVVSGVISEDTEWTLEGSPYIISGKVGVMSGVRLKINPGVSVVAEYERKPNMDGCILLVKGVIVAQGQVGEEVDFDALEIHFREANLDESKMSHISVPNGGGIQLGDLLRSDGNQSGENNGTLLINHSSFGKSSFVRTSGYKTTAKLILDHCKLNDSDVIGMSPTGEHIFLENCVVNNTRVGSYSSNMKLLLKNTQFDNTIFDLGNLKFDDCVVKTSLIRSSDTNALSIYNSKFVKTKFNIGRTKLIIKGSSVMAEGTTLRVETAQLEDNTFRFKSDKPLFELWTRTNTTKSVITRNTFYTKTGVFSVRGIVPASVITQNNFFNKSGYVLYNHSSYNLTAIENYWGSSEEEIKLNIFDFYDDIDRGEVDYSNFKITPLTNVALHSSVSKPLNVIKGLTIDGTKVSWSWEGKMSDLAGFRIYKGDDKVKIKEVSSNGRNCILPDVGLGEKIYITAINHDADGVDDLFDDDESVFSEEAKLFVNPVVQKPQTACDDKLILVTYKETTKVEVAQDIKIQLSDASGDFSHPTALRYSEIEGRRFTYNIPQGLSPEGSYRFRLYSELYEMFSEATDLLIPVKPTANFLVKKSGNVYEQIVVKFQGEARREAVFNWDLNGGEVVSQKAGGEYVVQWQQEGEKKITLTIDDNGCLSDPVSHTILVVEKPVPEKEDLPTITQNCLVESLEAPKAISSTFGEIKGTTTTSFPIRKANEDLVVVWTYDDEHGALVAQEQIVRVVDTSMPVLEVDELPVIVSECELVELQAPKAIDNCKGEIEATTNTVFPISKIGDTEITWTFDDGNGNIVHQKQIVRIEDNKAPVPVVQTLPTFFADCSAISPEAPKAIDECQGEILGVPDVTFPITTPGEVLITWYYTDSNNYQSKQTQLLVLKQDLTGPIPNIENLPTVESQCEVTKLDYPKAMDNCSGEIQGTTTVEFPITKQGDTEVIWQFEDENGNVSEQTQIVRITDTESPEPLLPTLPLMESQCEITKLDSPKATDNCSGEVLGTTTVEFPITKQGDTKVIWRFEDENGNVSEQTQIVRITDTESPEPLLATLPLIESQCEVTKLDYPKAMDNCSGEVQGTTTVEFPITKQGDTEVIWRFEDENGNVSEQTQIVRITDTENPAPSEIELPTIERWCAIESLPAPTADDNCAGVIIAKTETEFPVSEIGETKVVWSFDDGNGHVVTQEQIVRIHQIDKQIDLQGEQLVARELDAEYQWMNLTKGLSVKNETNRLFTFTEEGEYAVTIIKEGCEVQSDSKTVRILGLENEMKDEVAFAPNPSDGVVDIKSSTVILNVRLLDLNGNVVLERSGSGKSLKLNAKTRCSAGIYVLEVRTQEGTVRERIAFR